MRAGHFFDARSGCRRTNIVGRQDVERLLGAERTREFQAVKTAAEKIAMQVKKRREVPSVLDMNQRRRIAHDVVCDLIREMLDRGVVKKRGWQNFPAARDFGALQHAYRQQ